MIAALQYVNNGKIYSITANETKSDGKVHTSLLLYEKRLLSHSIQFQPEQMELSYMGGFSL